MTTLGERWAAEFPRWWRQQGFAQGWKEGLEQGRQEGLAQGRREGSADLLVVQVGLRFGHEAGEEARALLAEAEDWDRLANVGDLIVRTESSAEFLRRLVSIVRRPNKRSVDLLSHQVAFKFGYKTGEQAKALLAKIDDWDRLGEAADLVVLTESGAEFLRRLASVVRRSN